MSTKHTENSMPGEFNSLVSDVIDAVESGEFDSAFDNVAMTAGNLARTKNTKNFTKNYLMACINAGDQGVSEVDNATALGLVNAFRRMNAEAPLERLPESYKIFAVKLPHIDGKPVVEIYIKEGIRVLYGERILPRGVLTENFLSVIGANLI